ncbi:protein FAM3C [Cebidichthys violaceus]|uniref:protein FAM3C n=1 Tax=Cebidichthys violaceus TaxID=271503 RepID=UPI0035CB55CC
MRYQAVWNLAAVISILFITWILATNSSFDVREKAGHFLGFIDKSKFQGTIAEPKCSLTRVCPPDHFALRISSGAANAIGPKICFEGKIIMSYVMNNVGPGLNIVVVNGTNGKVEKFRHFNMFHGKTEEILAYLKEIKPGMIVLVASFEDVTPKMTDEIREVFVGMGSTLIKSVKRRDNWVFAGRAGTENKSPFEKQTVNDDKINIFEGWPDMVEISGCIPRNQTDIKGSS